MSAFGVGYSEVFLLLGAPTPPNFCQDNAPGGNAVLMLEDANENVKLDPQAKIGPLMHLSSACSSKSVS
jgi:hypothetical protein